LFLKRKNFHENDLKYLKMPKEIAKILIEYMNQENNENEQKNNFIKK
jgi:hypothetical protein